MSLNYQAAIEINAQYIGQVAVNQANKDLKNLGATTTDLKTQLQGLAKQGLSTLVAAFGVEKIVEFSKSIIDLGKGLSDLSQKTGIGAQALSSLKTAAEIGGLNFESMEKSLKKFSVTAADAASGSDKSQRGFESLGISVKDANGQVKTADQLLFEVADKFEKFKDGPNKAAIAVKLFGKAGSDMIPVLNEGSAALKQFGVRVGDEFIKQADKFYASLVLMKVNTQQLGIDIISGALPALNDLAAAFIELGTHSEQNAKEVSGLGEVLRQIGVVAITAGEVIAEGFDAVASTGVEILGILKLLIDEFIDLGYVGNAAIQAITLNFDAAKDSLSKFADSAKKDFQSFGTASLGLADDLGKKTEERFKKTADLLAKLEQGSAIFGTGKSAAPDIAKPKGTGDFNLADDTALKAQKDKVKAIQEEVEKLRASYDLEANAVNLSTAEYEKQKIAIDETLKLKKELLSFKDPGQKAELEKATDALIAQKQALIELKEQQKQSFGQGAKEALKEYVENVSDVAAQSKKLFTDAFKGMEDAFVNFVQTGKLSFADLAKSIEADLIRIAYRALIVKPLVGALGLGFADGGIMTDHGSMPLKKYASGGVATSPQLAVFGEGRTPEAYVPLPDGRSIPVTVKGGAGGGDTNVVVNVNVASSGDTQQDTQSNTRNGRTFGALLAAAVRSEILNQKRPGGLLSAGA